MNEVAVDLRSTEESQLDSMLKVAIEGYNALTDVSDEEATELTEELSEKAENLVDIHLEIVDGDSTVTLSEDDWRLVVSALGHPDVVHEEGKYRVEHLRTKLYWRGVQNEERVMGVPPFLK